MRSIRRKVLFTGLALLAFASSVWAQDPMEAQFSKEFEHIKARLSILETQRQEIALRQDKILQELNLLGVQLRKNPKRKAH